MAGDPSPQPQTLEPGEVLLDHYVVDRQIAEGGMAAIHRAADRRHNRVVVVKALYPHYSKNPVVCTRFLDEGRIQRYLDHPNIIDVYDIVETPHLGIVMEYIDGPNLDGYLDDHGPLNPAELLNLIMPVLSAVGFAHQRGVIHRDIKPSNILLKLSPAEIVPKIMDFGVAKVDRGEDLTATGTTVGTLHYMSPEQIVGAADIDGRADIYSLGVTLYKLSTGEVPFNASTEFALMMAQVEAPPTPPTQLRGDLPDRLEAIILKALAKQPEDRYQSVGQLTAALLDLEADASSYAETETDTVPLPPELLRHAMMADEIATDRTGELNMARLEELIGQADPSESVATEESPAKYGTTEADEKTIQLDTDQLRKHVRRDKDVDTLEAGPKPATLPAEPSSDRRVDSQESTHPFDSDNRVDSQETTNPLDKPGADAETDEIDNAGGSESTAAEQSLSQETTQPFGRKTHDKPSGQHRSDDPDQVSEFRARASRQDAVTKRSRAEIQEEFGRIERADNSSLSRRQRWLIGVFVALIVGLLAAITWFLYTG